MTIDEAIESVDRLLSVLDNELLKITEEIAINATTLIIHRIQTDGIGKQYSSKKVPAYLFLLDENRLDTQQTVNAIRKIAEAEDPEDRFANWADVREAHGNQISFVDLTFTGRMFQNIGVITTEKVGNQYQTTVAGFDEETRKKMKWNAERYGQFFSSSESEIKMLQGLFDERIIELTKIYF